MREVSSDTQKRGYGVALLDRLTRFSTKGKDDIQPKNLKENFGAALYQLYSLKSKLEGNVATLESKCRSDELEFRTSLNRLRQTLSNLQSRFGALDTRVNTVSRNLVQLSDQLERKNIPRKRIEEAHSLILEFYKFMGAGGGTSMYVAINSPSDENQLLEAANRIRNLSSLCLELPNEETFLFAKQRITVANQQLESALLDRFRINFANGNTAVMKRIAEVLANSKSHTACADVFIEEALRPIDPNQLVFKDIKQTLLAAEKDIISVFPRPEAVLVHLINGLFNMKIKPYLSKVVTMDEGETQVFLTSLYTEYQNLDKLIKELSDELTLITDPAQLSKLFRDSFSTLLDNYASKETAWLTDRLRSHLSQFYTSRGHEKQKLHTSGLADLTRDLRSMFGKNAGDRTVFAESLLSEEVAVNIIEDVRQAAKRMLLLSHPSDFPENGKLLFDLLNTNLIEEHVYYGILYALQDLQRTDPRYTPSSFTFFSVVHCAASILQFFSKTSNESILPLVNTNSQYMQTLLAKRQSILNELETKLQTGLDRCLTLMIGQVNHILSTQQRKTDFRPDTDETGNLMSNQPSQACRNVKKFIEEVIKEARKFLDGVNLKEFLAELGMRLNRTLVDHFYGFTYNDTGGFLAMQDVTAYREVARDLDNPVVSRLFNVLLKLINLMLIKPENVQQVLLDYLQLGIPKELLMQFIQMRSDYKTSRLQIDL